MVSINLSIPFHFLNDSTKFENSSRSSQAKKPAQSLNYDVLFYFMGYYDLLWHAMMYLDSSWYSTIHYELILFQTIFDLWWFITIYFVICSWMTYKPTVFLGGTSLLNHPLQRHHVSSNKLAVVILVSGSCKSSITVWMRFFSEKHNDIPWYSDVCWLMIFAAINHLVGVLVG